MQTTALLLALAACQPEAPAPEPTSEPGPAAAEAAPVGLHWFIPDGMRADPEVFNVFRWAQEGKLPNIARLMERGTWGYSIPTFPSHTPTNFATLLTGAFPVVHGVADGPMHVEGRPLSRPSVGGFSSAARKVPAVWSVLEDAGREVFLLSVPGSTPPELQSGSTVRGRWGGWGADLPSVLFERESPERRKALGREARLFLLGEDLTRFITPAAPGEWDLAFQSFTDPVELTLSAHGLTLYGLMIDEADDGVDAFNKIVFSLDREEVIASLSQGEWGPWIPAKLTWGEATVDSHVRPHVVRLTEDGGFRLRLQVDALNRLVAEPPEVSDALHEAAGPMVDFVDNFPAQLVHYPEDKQTFLDEAHHSLDWHRQAVDAVYERYKPQVFIHDIYTPNQMLTSRWWMGAVDPDSARYEGYSEEEREALWEEVKGMYQGLDAIVGRAMEDAGDNAVIVLSSDHGAAPLNRTVRLNNLFAEEGWLSVKEDPATGAPIIDWEDTRVVFLNMYSVYIHPDGLGGDWTRASGPGYEALREEVAAALTALTDEDGASPVASVTRWEDAAPLNLPADRVGDLIVANHPGYGWSEETTEDRAVFAAPRVAGYKQSIEPGSTKAVWTPFVIAGPGIKANNPLPEPIRHIDQLPTILTAMGVPLPEHLQGSPLKAALE
jgi:predicted AlkP superfamily phosphohydrolase/phosphomutase